MPNPSQIADWFHPWLQHYGLNVACIISGAINWIVQARRKGLNLFYPPLLFEYANGAAVPPILILMAGSVAFSVLTYLEHGDGFVLFFSGLAAIFALVNASFGPLKKPPRRIP
jgi:hypothetical protein